MSARNLSGIHITLVLASTIAILALLSQNITAQNTTSAVNATSAMNNTSENATLLRTIPLPIPLPQIGTVANFTPPAAYEKLSEIPSYAVRIPFSNLGDIIFDPQSTAIPEGMTVIWFNDDQNPHTVTINTTSSVVEGENVFFDSGMIAPQGFFIHRFAELGTYVYYDSVNPSAKGRITVGDIIEIGNNMDMLIGGDVLPFNASQLKRLTVSFVPTNTSAITIPPNLNLLYNVSIGTSNTTLFSKQFEDSDGILDLELVPTSKSSSVKHFVTWGPDVADIAGHRNSGTYHIQGPVLVEDKFYLIKVDIVSKDGTTLSPPITDTFILPSVGGK